LARTLRQKLQTTRGGKEPVFIAFLGAQERMGDHALLRLAVDEEKLYTTTEGDRDIWSSGG